MKTVTFIAESGNLDSQNNQVFLDGLGLERKPLITSNFSAEKVVGVCDELRITPAGLEATVTFRDDVVDGYPAIGFVVEEWEPNSQGGKNFTKARLRQISICSSPNADSTIKRISEQG